MKIDSAVSSVADFLWKLLTDERTSPKSQSDLQTALTEAGHGDVTSAELNAAIDRISSRLPSDSVDRIEPLRAAVATPPPVVQTRIVREVVHDTQVVNNTRIVREQPVTNNNVINKSTEQQISNTFVREGDKTFVREGDKTFVREGDNVVDNRTITEINARGDVDFDQKIDNDTVVATKGGVAVNGDVEDVAISTGINTGVIAGGDVDVEDSVIGDGNTQLNDSEVGAIATKGGDATNIEGENVNTGSGDLTDVDTDGGDAQVVKGNGNDVTGDVDLNAEGADGPVNVAVGDGNAQKAEEDGSTNVEDSGNTDNSVEGSANTSVDGSLNASTTDTDVTEVKVDDSGNTTTQDNDTTTATVQQSTVDNGLSADNDTAEFDLQASATTPVLEPEGPTGPTPAEDQPAGAGPAPTGQQLLLDDPLTPQDESKPTLVDDPLTPQDESKPTLVDDPLTPQDESKPTLVDDPLTPQDESKSTLVDDPLTPEDESLGLTTAQAQSTLSDGLTDGDDGLLAIPADDPSLLGAGNDVDLDFNDGV